MLKPLTIQTDIASCTATNPIGYPVQFPSKDNSFMMYPVGGVNKTTTPMDVYGPEHFLRLFGTHVINYTIFKIYENETQNTLYQPLTPFWYTIFCKNSYYETQSCLKIVISKYLMKMRKVRN